MLFKTALSASSLLLAAQAGYYDYSSYPEQQLPERIYAKCVVTENPTTEPPTGITGLIKFEQAQGPRDLMVRAEITGIQSDSTQIGFHIHTEAFDGENCSSAAGHYNPQGVNHGAWNDAADARHVGDLKMLRKTRAGNGSYRYQDS